LRSDRDGAIRPIPVEQNGVEETVGAMLNGGRPPSTTVS